MCPDTLAMETNKRSSADISHVEKPSDSKLIDNDAELYGISHEEHNRTFRKVDWHLMPLLMALYLISNLDR